MIEKPVEIEQPLVDDVLVRRALVLDDHRGVVFIEPESVNSAAVHFARHILRCKKADAEKGVQVALDPILEVLLDVSCSGRNLKNVVPVDAEQFEVTHRER